MTSQLDLLKTRRFLPMFGTQITSAFNDNLFKSAFLVLVTFGNAERGGLSLGALGAIAGAALILPFFLFSSTAGELADKFERSRLLRLLKLAEVVLVLGGGAALVTGNLALSLITLFLLGCQSTFTSPIKYSLLPQHLTESELVNGNAVMDAGTFLFILVGTIAGNVSVAAPWVPQLLAVVMVAVALAGVVASRFVPPAPAPSPGLPIRANIAAGTWQVMRDAAAQPDAFRAILGASWFWVFGATYLSQFPAWTKEVLHADSTVVLLFLAAFSIGIGLGSTLCGRLMRGEVSARLVPRAAVGMAIGSSLMWLWGRPPATTPTGDDLVGLGAFLSQVQGWQIFAALLLVAVAGGMYAVPLYAIMQDRSAVATRARVIAANNIMNALFMTAGSVVVAILLSVGLTIPQLFLVLSGLTLIAARYVNWKLAS